MRDNPRVRAMQGRGNPNQAIFTAYQTRAEDPIDLTNRDLLLKGLTATVIRDAKELEAAIMSTDDTSQSTENERAAQVLDKLYGSRNIVQSKPQSKRTSNNISATRKHSFPYAVVVGALIAAYFLRLDISMLLYLCLEVFQMHPFGVLVFLSFVFGVLVGSTR